MGYSTLENIKRKVDEYSKLINAPDFYLPMFGYNNDFAQPSVHFEKSAYNYVVKERGIELSCSSTKDSDELIYWIFRDITFSMACDYELNNRIHGQDFRRILFDEQIRLIGLINKNYIKKLTTEKNIILQKHPYSDDMKTD